MKYFITGATGFLGYHITKQLLEKNETVFALIHNRNFSLDLNLSHPNLHLIHGNILEPDSFKTPLKEADYVIHCANIVSFDTRKKILMYDVNVTGTENILSLSLKHKIKKTVYVSSVDTLGIPLKGTLGNEETPYNWGKCHIPYMDTKYLAEQKVLKYIKRGLNAVIVNPGTLFGDGDVNFNSTKYLFAVNKGLGKYYINGGFTQSIVNNVADGVIKALKKGEKGEKYILGGFNFTYKEFFNLLADVLNKQKPSFKIPTIFFNVGGNLVYAYNKIRKQKALLSPDLIKAAPENLFYSSQKAMDILGFNPGTLDELRAAIKKQFLFYKNLSDRDKE